MAAGAAEPVSFVKSLKELRREALLQNELRENLDLVDIMNEKLREIRAHPDYQYRKNPLLFQSPKLLLQEVQILEQRDILMEKYLKLFMDQTQNKKLDI